MRDQLPVASMLFVCPTARLSQLRNTLRLSYLSKTSAVAQTDISMPACRLQALAYKQVPLYSRQQQQGARWTGAVCVSSLCLPGFLFLLIERTSSCTPAHPVPSQNTSYEQHPETNNRRISDGTCQALDRLKSIQETHRRRRYERHGTRSWTGPTLGAKSRRREASARNILAGH